MSETALSLVRGLDDIHEIWKRLKATYGDTRMLLVKKADTLSGDSLSKIRDPEKIVMRISRIINTLRDLLKLASKHKIQMQLFHDEALEKIYKSMGEYRMTRWLEQTCKQDLTEKLLWSKLITFLEKEVKIQQQKMMLQRPKSEDTSREIKEKGERSRYHLNK